MFAILSLLENKWDNSERMEQIHGNEDYLRATTKKSFPH